MEPVFEKQLQGAENPDSASISGYQRVDLLPISIIEFEAKNRVTEIQSKAPINKESLYKEPCLEVFVPPPIA